MVIKMDKLHEIFASGPDRITVSKPSSKEVIYKKAVITKMKDGYQIEKFTQKQAFHKNVTPDEAESFCRSVMGKSFLQLNARENMNIYCLFRERARSATKRKNQTA